MDSRHPIPSAVLPPLALVLALLLPAPSPADPPAHVLDLADRFAGTDAANRTAWWAFGADGVGSFGVPVTAGADLDGDGLPDLAVAYMTASPLGRFRAGEVVLIFGDAALGDTGADGAFERPLDLAGHDPRILRILGAAAGEVAGNEIWIDDVTGDGLGDLLIGRQNHDPGNRPGAGALTVVPGGPGLRTVASGPGTLDLAAPPEGLGITSLVAARATDRLGIWMRTGDVTGDGVADVVVGADQEDGADPTSESERNRGAVYLLRGGEHLASGATADLAAFSEEPETALGPLASHVAKIVPPSGARDFHLGATCQVADLDANGHGEVLAAATLNRAGASLGPPADPGSARPRGGAPGGRVYIVWDENFPAGPWPPGFTLDLGDLPGDLTDLRGEDRNLHFGEELLGGFDADGDGHSELFVGDLTALQAAGLGHVFFRARHLRGRLVDLSRYDAPIPDGLLAVTRIFGFEAGDLTADTAVAGDFDGDGRDDLLVTSPHASPLGRVSAGTAHVLFGRDGAWPAEVNLAPASLPAPELLAITEIRGRHGRVCKGGGVSCPPAATDEGDTLGYSASAADLDGDGRLDLVVNEMTGRGLAPGTEEVGNLVVIRGAAMRPESPPAAAPRLVR